MKENAIITISGLQAEVNADESVELSCIGNYTKKNKKHYLSYDEVDDDGKITKCHIKITDNSVDYTRNGVSVTQMFFVVGETFESLYETPFGSFQMGMDTKTLSIREREDDETDSEMLAVKLEYGLTINGSFVSNCNLNIKVEEMNI